MLDGSFKALKKPLGVFLSRKISVSVGYQITLILNDFPKRQKNPIPLSEGTSFSPSFSSFFFNELVLSEGTSWRRNPDELRSNASMALWLDMQQSQCFGETRIINLRYSSVRSVVWMLGFFLAFHKVLGRFHI